MLQMIFLNLYNVRYAVWMTVNGMLGIFLFMGIFYLLIYVLDKSTQRQKEQ